MCPFNRAKRRPHLGARPNAALAPSRAHPLTARRSQTLADGLSVSELLDIVPAEVPTCLEEVNIDPSRLQQPPDPVPGFMNDVELANLFGLFNPGASSGPWGVDSAPGATLRGPSGPVPKVDLSPCTSQTTRRTTSRVVF